jgi:DNA-binding NarL/FixJ family response regulator
MSGSAGERIRVLVVGESAIVRAGLEAAAAQSDRFEVVGTCPPSQAVAMIQTTFPGAVLVESGTFSGWGPYETISGPKPVAPLLTPRESEVFRLMADGASNKLIAHKLGISDHTAKFHVTSILSKMNAGSRTEAVTLGVRMGLIYL